MFLGKNKYFYTFFAHTKEAITKKTNLALFSDFFGLFLVVGN